MSRYSRKFTKNRQDFQKIEKFEKFKNFKMEHFKIRRYNLIKIRMSHTVGLVRMFTDLNAYNLYDKLAT